MQTRTTPTLAVPTRGEGRRKRTPRRHRTKALSAPRAPGRKKKKKGKRGGRSLDHAANTFLTLSTPARRLKKGRRRQITLSVRMPSTVPPQKKGEKRGKGKLTKTHVWPLFSWHQPRGERGGRGGILGMSCHLLLAATPPSARAC